MSRLHICNTFFEHELQTRRTHTLSHWQRSHPIVLQLQFLPLLYAKPDDCILVSDLPHNPDPRLCLAPLPNTSQIIHWGPSQSIAAWANEHNIPYQSLNQELLCQMNSKTFSFNQSPKLPFAQLLKTPEEISAWLITTPGPKVLKHPLGTAGRGHILNPNVKQLYKGPLIGEPWVHRLLDFSTQWDEGKLIGVTLFENEPNGTYKRTFTGDLDPFVLQEHLFYAQPLVDQIKQLGYSGNLGIDSFIYQWGKEKRVHPIVEINCRKTMSWVALQTPTQEISFTKSQFGRLPSSLLVNGAEIFFARNIIHT